MINMEILEDFSGLICNDQIIAKGKRTKRLRPSSSSSTSSGGGGEFNYNSSLVSSPNTSSGISTSTEEDEDMAANCLILLARGGFSPPPSKDETQPESKLISRRKFTEIAVTAAEGKVGIYVYECKTCNRTFPSFQALGGHRASHKKPKPNATTNVDQKKSPPPAAAPPPPSTQPPKIHDCSICGSEFASGQALGGHMRRHRSASTNTANDDVGEKARNMLELDLNLPAPTEDDGGGAGGEAKFHRFSPNHQARLVFSAVALVDCHY